MQTLNNSETQAVGGALMAGPGGVMQGIAIANMVYDLCSGIVEGWNSVQAEPEYGQCTAAGGLK